MATLMPKSELKNRFITGADANAFERKMEDLDRLEDELEDIRDQKEEAEGYALRELNYDEQRTIDAIGSVLYEVQQLVLTPEDDPETEREVDAQAERESIFPAV